VVFPIALCYQNVKKESHPINATRGDKNVYHMTSHCAAWYKFTDILEDLQPVSLILRIVTADHFHRFANFYHTLVPQHGIL
jgi:hypothetical protein